MSSPRLKKKNLRWRVDCDYAESLPPPERAWLNKFVDEYYRAEFNSLATLHRNPDHIREIYSARSAEAADVMTVLKRYVPRNDKRSPWEKPGTGD